MREVTTHKVNGLNGSLDVIAGDELGPGGAPVEYQIQWCPTGSHFTAFESLRFQNGPLGDDGPNGVSNEALLAIVIDRLEQFQKGPFPCDENALALTHLDRAMSVLHKRTKDRAQRGVEGKLEK